MKKLSLLFLIALVVALPFCKTSKKASKTAVAKITYDANVQPLVMNNCSPCHFPPKGNKKPLDTYDGVKGAIDSMLVRVQKTPGDKGFMPFKHDKLSDSTINILVQWKNDGLLQK